MAATKHRALIIDDEASIRDVLSGIFAAEGFEAVTAENGERGIELLKRDSFQIVVTDLRMPKVDGLAVLRYMHDHAPGCLGIVATAYGNVDTAVDALRMGAFDFITKPFHLDEIRQLIRRAAENLLRHDQEGEAAARREPGSCGRIETIIGSSPATAQVCNLILTVAESDSTVLLLGDSGTGKELAARAIHRHSRRARRPLIAVNCAAIPEDLLESELFGHVRGSFTGAIANRPGRFSLADGGTIFLDEIGDMTPKLQVKVLRVLQEQEFEAVGATETTRVNVRVIAATNQDLEARVKEKKFREDLFYRLNVIPIRMPSLRERIDDIPELIDHFIARFNQESGSRLSGASAEALALMRQYPWPGNIRELENLIERLSVLVGEGEIGAQDLPEKFHGGGDSPLPGDLFAIPPDGVDLNKMVDEYETRLILQALRKSNGVKNQAAKLLRIKRTTLVEKMKKKNIQF